MSFRAIENASSLLADNIHKTPVLTSKAIDKITLCRHVYFKAENFQKTGSFKARGALNAVLRFVEGNPDCEGLCTYSTGNHGIALAWAAQKAGIRCAVVVPKDTAFSKKQSIVGYGAELILCQPDYKAWLATCETISKQRGYAIIPPFDNLDVIAGQGTIGLEFLEEVPHLDAILVPVGGGGLISGIALAAKTLKPSIKVFAVVPEGKDLEQSLIAERRLWKNPPKFIKTHAVAVRCQQPGLLNFPIILEYVEKNVITVKEEDVIDAMRLVFERLKIVIEMSAAMGVAAVISERVKELDTSIQNIGIILSGGNIDIGHLPFCT